MVRPNPTQIARFAAWLPQLDSVNAFDFCAGGGGELFPAAGAPGALESFFLNAAHQFGFWYARDHHYDRPMIATVGGVDRKGSDYLFYCFQRALNTAPTFFEPEHLAQLSDAELDQMFWDDEGRNPLPMWQEHLAITRAYAQWFLAENETPTSLVAACNQAEQPLATFLDRVGAIPGYAEDPLKKKLMLLAVILENRPEQFLRVTDSASAVPIIDYHLQRSALRTGLVEVTDAKVRADLAQRRMVSDEVEGQIRNATYTAIDELVQQSGLSVAAIDYFFFTNRTRCPEMTEPQCAACPVEPVCAQRRSLFQPVFRTTAY